MRGVLRPAAMLHKSALSLAQRAVERDPNHVGCRLILGDVLRAQGARDLSDAQYALAERLTAERVTSSDGRQASARAEDDLR